MGRKSRDTYVIDGMKDNDPDGPGSRAGRKAEELAGLAVRAKFEDLIAADGIPRRRMGDQDRDGVAVEVIYPSVGMILSTIPIRLQESLFRRYTFGLAEYGSPHPDRLMALGQTRMRSPEKA